MDYEKLYKEALERAREYHKVDKDNTLKIYAKGTMEYLFPVLKELEDEKMLREIKRYIKEQGDKPTGLPNGSVAVSDMLDWLEKQGEQNPVDFKAKDWYVSKVDGKIHNMTYNPTDKIEPKFKVGDTMRTLQEAKDGWTDGMPFVVSIDSEYYNCNSEKIAIKDQDNYEYPPINRKQKPAWSEEDENMLEDIRFNYEFNKSGMTEGLIEQYNKWFEKIKSLKPQSHWKPSEEQIQALEYQVNSTYKGSWQYRASKELLEQLKKL